MAKLKVDVWTHNFAQDKELADKTAGYFVPRIKVVRTNRYPLEEAWWRFFNMWNVTKDGYHNYMGRAQLYIPEVRKNIEAQARQLTKSAFPSGDCFDVSPGLTGTRKGAQAWKSWHTWAMENCQLQMKYFIAMRQMCMLGTAPIYLPWKTIERSEFRTHRVGAGLKAQRHKVEIFNGPDFVLRDLFKWYKFNPKKPDLSDGCFEINVVSPFELADLHRRGLCENYDDIKVGPSNAYLMEELSRDVLRAEALGINIQYNMAYAGEATIRKDADERNIADTTFERARIFTDMVFPEACEEDEDPEVPIPMMVDLYGNTTCGLIQRNPFFHQTPPYVQGFYIPPNADEGYGQGIPWAIQYMQYELNAKAEQGLDSATIAANPLAIIDPGLAGASNEFAVEPGAIWWANPTGVKFGEFTDTTEVTNRAILQLKSMMEDYSDRSPALPPQLLGKSRTATQSEMVFDSLGVDNWLFQMNNEINILTPMLQQWESLCDQHTKDKQFIMILGREAGDMKRTLLAKSDLIGRYAYEWKGASVAANKQVTSRQMLDFLKVVGSLPPGALQGMNINYNQFLQILWTDLWSLKNGDSVLGVPELAPTQDADAENEMLSMGLEIEVGVPDDDAAHIADHDRYLPKLKSEAFKTLMMTHILEHKKQMEQKKQMALQQQQAQAFQQKLMLLQAQGGRHGGGRSKSQASGNRTQLSPNASTGDMASGGGP